MESHRHDFDQITVHGHHLSDYLNELIQAINQAQATFKSQKFPDENENFDLKQLQELDNLLQSKRNLIECLNSNEFIS
ncbi:unnamed protein product, partial [Rotaria sp. Silwood2]